jgi:hypothetical protein
MKPQIAPIKQPSITETGLMTTVLVLKIPPTTASTTDHKYLFIALLHDDDEFHYLGNCSIFLP